MNLQYISIDVVYDSLLFELFSNNNLLLYTDVPIITAIQNVEIVRNFYSQPRIIFFIKNDDEVLGFVAAYCNVKHRTATVTCVLLPQFHHKGIMRQSLKWFHHVLFTQYNIYRVEAQICTKNLASIRLFETLGYTNEGLLRKNFMINNFLHDSYMYALFRDVFLN